MRQLMKQAVDRVYSLLWYKETTPKRYRDLVEAAFDERNDSKSD